MKGWPIRLLRTETVPRVVMCRRARGTDDPDHQPDEIPGFDRLSYCTCGASLYDAEDLKALPLY